MTTPYLERIAMAMRETSGGQPFSWENAARAALEAAREPDEEMLQDGEMANCWTFNAPTCVAWEETKPEWKAKYRQMAAASFRAMITRALGK